MNYGMNGSHYPGHHGGGMAGKPNVYVYGNVGQEFKISFNFSEKSLLLSAIPQYIKEWNGVIVEDGIVHNKAFYRYYYYDYGLDIDKLQWTSGKCVLKEELIDYLNSLLNKSGFFEKEIHDFNEYWSYKMPEASEYCVFPQGNKELKMVAELHVEPKASLNRVTFFIVPQVKIDHVKNRPFFNRPKKEWESTNSKRQEALHINEWGVAWVDESIYN